MRQGTRVTIEHIVVSSHRPYEQVKAALEAQLGVLKSAAEFVQQLGPARSSWEQVTQAMEKRLGISGFSIFNKVEQGQLLAFEGKPRRVIQYAIGNPLLAIRMIEHAPEIALYAPLRVAVFEGAQGGTCVTYDRFHFPARSLSTARDYRNSSACGEEARGVGGGGDWRNEPARPIRKPARTSAGALRRISMDVRALLGLSALVSFAASVVAATLWIWPRIRTMNRSKALVPLVAPHMFFRTIGLSFLVPGVVSPSLPAAFAVPAAYGDLVAGILSIVAMLALAKCARWAVGLVWVFNVWGVADLLYAIYAGNVHVSDPGMFGAAFFIPTAIVPPLLVTHALVFLVLLRLKRS